MQTSFKHTGNFVYENNQLAYILIPEGRALPDGNGGFQYQYYLKDHLGNTRILFDENKTVLQNYSYYPFGMEQNGFNYTNTSTLKNNYLYNGKELQDDFGLEWYDYGARFYDGVLGRFTTIDPKADERVELTAYNYTQNNPISRIDPDGKFDDWYQSANGALIWQDENKEQIKINGENFKNVGNSVSIGTEDGNYVNYYQNVPVSISNVPVNAEQTVLSNPGVKAKLLGKNSPLSVKSQTGLFQASIHQGQYDFLNHPVTKATANGLLFVATGGVEGVISLGSSGIKMGSQFLKFADEASLKTYVSVNMKGNVWKNNIIKDASKFVWENSSFTAKKWMINNNVTSTVSKIYNTNYEYVGPKALDTYMKMKKNINSAIQLFK